METIKTGYCVATPRYGKSFLCGIMSNHFAYEGENCYAVGSTQEYSGIIIQHAREILVKSHPDVKLCFHLMKGMLQQ